MLKSNVKIQEQNLLDETCGEDVGFELGVKMVKDYYDATGIGTAQFVGKNIIEKISLPYIAIMGWTRYG